ncbi:hypothetical protein AB837_00039 [bacterium AB1]|nr:hypothetical protein AB837_00039 [bacterium AB1]
MTYLVAQIQNKQKTKTKRLNLIQSLEINSLFFLAVVSLSASIYFCLTSYQEQNQEVIRTLMQAKDIFQKKFKNK